MSACKYTSVGSVDSWPEPQRDYRQVDAAPEQRHGRGVPQGVRCDGLRAERRADLTCGRRVSSDESLARHRHRGVHPERSERRGQRVRLAVATAKRLEDRHHVPTERRTARLSSFSDAANMRTDAKGPRPGVSRSCRVARFIQSALETSCGFSGRSMRPSHGTLARVETTR